MVDFNAGGGVVGMPGPFDGFINAVNSTNQTNAYLGNLNNVVTSPGYDPFAQSGGFGNQTAYYSGLGAAYGRATGGFGGYGAPNADPFTPVPGADGIVRDASGQIDQSNAGNIAKYWEIMRGGAPSGNVSRGPDLPDLSQNPFAPQQPTYPSVDPTPNVGAGAGGGGGWSPALLANGQIDQSNAGNIAKYWELMGGGGGASSSAPGSSGRNDLAAAMWQGTNSNTGAPDIGGTSSYPYSGNPYYMPSPMEGQDPIAKGGGFGKSGFGIGQGMYTGQPGFGLGIGTINGNGAPNVGRIPGVNGDGTSFGYGGLTGGSGGAWSPALLANGQIDQQNPGNIAKYWEIVGGR
jgi:hypothetical protein